MHHVFSLEIKVHYLDITAFLCCLFFGPSLTNARNQIQMGPESLNSQLFKVKYVRGSLEQG